MVLDHLAPDRSSVVRKRFGTGGGRVHRSDWECPDCGHDVFGSKDECPECGKWRAPRIAARRPGDWDCGKCRKVIFASKKRCTFCGHGVRPERSSRAAASAAPATGGWESAASDDAAAAAPPPPREKEEWKCAACGFDDNFERRPTCYKCDKPKDWQPQTESSGCVVCLAAPVETTLQACGHACMCRNCATQVHGGCPMCRKPFVPGQVIPLYLA